MNDMLSEGAAMPAVLPELRTWTGAISGWTRILQLRRSTSEADRALQVHLPILRHQRSAAYA